MSDNTFTISSVQKHLVVEINQDILELMRRDQHIAPAIHKPSIDVATIVMEIADSRENTPEVFLTFFDEYTPGLLNSAFEEECELIYFYLAY
ncbi:MAG: hypothetical protein ACJAS1_005512 [Oleiphilaceae bacterium]|jgi:hypothetical protein